MRVALISDCYHPTPNGVTGMVEVLRAGLAARGHQVVLAAPAPPRRATGDLPRADLALRSVSALPSVGVRAAPVGSAVVGRWFVDHDIEVVHTHTEGPVGLAARRAAVAAGLPLVHTLHTLYDHYLHYLRLPRLAPLTARRLAHRALSRFLAPTTRLIAPSAAALDHLAVLAPTVPATLIPNAVAAATPAPADLARQRARLGLAASDRVVLSVGRIAPEKRSRELFDALAAALAPAALAPAALAPADDIVAVLVGQGPQLPQLRRRAARLGLTHRLLLPGRLPHADVLALHHLAVVALSASLSENHPLSLLEAAAAGRPIAVRDDANLRGIVEDGVNGIVAASDADLVRRALALAGDPATCAAYGARSAAMAQRFGVEAHLDATEAVYTEVIAERAVRPGWPPAIGRTEH